MSDDLRRNVQSEGARAWPPDARKKRVALGRGSGGAYGGYPQADTGWLLFARIMIAAVGILDVIYGIAAIGNSSFFVGDARYILSDLNTWGWVMLVLEALQVIAAVRGFIGGAESAVLLRLADVRVAVREDQRTAEPDADVDALRAALASVSTELGLGVDG